jgi:hypothetical protein
VTITGLLALVCPRIGLAVITGPIASTERQYVELDAFVNEMALRIARQHEWRALKFESSFTGNGTTTTFAPPADFDRLPVDQKLWSTKLRQPLVQVIDDNEWLELKVRQYTSAIPRWSIQGGSFEFYPAPVAGDTIRYHYMSNRIVKPNTGVNKETFTLDSDSYVLDDQLLKLGTIYLWRQYKELSYAEEMADFEELKERLILAARGAKTIRIGPATVSRDAETAYPFPVTP